MLADEYGYAEMYDVLRLDLPPTSGKGMVVKQPVRLLGLQVTAMVDFHTYFLRSAVSGGNPSFHNEGGFFGFGAKKSEDRRKQLVVTKDFRLHRIEAGRAFDISPLTEWEVDPTATSKIPGNVAPD